MSILKFSVSNLAGPEVKSLYFRPSDIENFFKDLVIKVNSNVKIIFLVAKHIGILESSIHLITKI